LGRNQSLQIFEPDYVSTEIDNDCRNLIVLVANRLWKFAGYVDGCDELKDDAHQACKEIRAAESQNV